MTLNQFLIGGAIAIGVTLFSEVLSWVTKKLSGNPLQGFSAFFVTAGFSLVGGALYFAWTVIPAHYMQALVAAGAVIMVGAEFVFQTVVKNVPVLHVTSDTTMPSA